VPEVKQVSGGRGRRDFFAVARALNAADPIYTPPLAQDLARSLSDANPLWRPGRAERELFVAYDGDGRPVGRVLGHVNLESNQRHGEAAGLFGYLECGGDRAVGEALLAAVEQRHRARGLSELRGPYELTVAQCIGAVVSGFDEPASFSQSWNGPALPELLEALGFTRMLGMTTFRLDDVALIDPEALIGDKQRTWLARPGVRLRSFDMDRFEQDLGEALRLLNESFVGNFGFVPLSPDDLAFMAGPMKRVVRPELTIFLELEGRAAAVAMILPDFNILFRRMNGNLWPLGWASFLLGGRTLDAAVAQFIATDPALQNQGLLRIVVAEALRRLRAAGFRTLDGTWISDSNAPSRAQALAMGMREKHRLVLFTRPM
jgi:GNAT superfamily N-acetyltransferase